MMESNGKSSLPAGKRLNVKKLKQEIVAAGSEKYGRNKANKLKENVEMIKEELKQLEDPPLTKWEINIMSARLPYSFFDTPCEELAQNLLGKILVRKLENGTILKGRIVETESYLGTVDKASQTYEYRVSARNLPLYMPPGTINVYFTYGMYHCFNISSQGDGTAVLIRGLEPLEGLDQMTENRNSKKKSNSKQFRKEFKSHELCNGPSKFCMAFSLEKKHSKYSLCSWKGLWIEEDKTNQEEIKIIHCKRIGIDSCGAEWANKPLRYYIYGNNSVSKRDKKAEMISLEEI
ncbi:DNA-3-methyladenine glycosylase-like isoform X2 [Belonocnema kinseyi]|nr:DNA-3-methyladenine glycosylase-like isoform X2 [Belonocnema kinseyi]